MIPNAIRTWPRSSFFLRNALNRLLALSMAFSILLVLARVIHSGHLGFCFLVWNLFLAWIPWFLTQWLAEQKGWSRKKFPFVMIFLLWLLFIPNSLYILTDLFHLTGETNEMRAPIWYDLILIFSFAWNGLILGILSIRQMEKLVQYHFPKIGGVFFLYPVMWLNALGVYIGRYLRYNSWDIAVSPLALMRDIGRILLHPLIYHGAWSMIFCFSTLMTLMYLTLKKLASPFSSAD